MQLFSQFEDNLCFRTDFFFSSAANVLFSLMAQFHVACRKRMVAHAYVQMSVNTALAYAQQADMAANRKGEETLNISFQSLATDTGTRPE